MRYQIIVNDDERVANDDPSDFEKAVEDFRDLLSSGYYDVEEVLELPDEIYDGDEDYA